MASGGVSFDESEESPSLGRNRSSGSRPARRSIVHFSDDEDGSFAIESNGGLNNHEIQPILIEALDDQRDKSLSLYFGMLQEGFEYSIDVKIPIQALAGYVKAGDTLQISKMPTHAGVPSYTCTGEFLNIVLEIPVTRVGDWNGHLEDFFRIHAAESPKWTVSVKFSAKILRYGMGKPTLRHGVTCVRAITFEETISEPEADDDVMEAEFSDLKT